MFEFGAIVQCTKFWVKNEESAKYCVKCCTVLEGSRSSHGLDSVDEWAKNFGKLAERWRVSFGKRTEEECFGFPHGGTLLDLLLE